ncbi:MAG: hypothetical protein DRJ03_14635 [Chloroflexi bacterium]|nr:MAG: hypothetical protein B6I35_07125 [Anaerolineaceae bacterium 4572_32.2]RLC75090.1 MAG: hypothetical protein DRI81_12710 [Chloroflexota bacterium]RLC84292.1 MAG: hypothetical protein DRJ03_14635 [Chloroflexota bacterium]
MEITDAFILDMVATLVGVFATAIPVMGEKSGRSRDFAIAQGALRGKIHASWKSRLQNGNCCIR